MFVDPFLPFSASTLLDIPRILKGLMRFVRIIMILLAVGRIMQVERRNLAMKLGLHLLLRACSR